MARRRLTDEEEQRLAQQAEAERDDPQNEWVSSPVRVSPGASVVLSVRLPIDRAQALRAAAADRKMSLSELLDEAVASLLAGGGPRLVASENITRLWVYGGLGPGVSWTDEFGAASDRRPEPEVETALTAAP